MVVKFFFTFLLSILFLLGAGQDSSEKEKWLPIFNNRLPTRFFTFQLDGIFQHSINSTSDLEEIGDGHADVLGNRIMSIGLKFPILNRDKVVLTGGAKYTDEEFYFDDFEPVDYPLYVSLNDRNLKSLGGDINGFIRLNKNRSILMRSSFYLAGDFYRSGDYFNFDDLLKISLALGYGIKKDANTYYGFGGYLGYTFGKPSIYPAFVFHKQFAGGIGIEAVLPQSFKAWKKFSEKFYLYGRTKVTGNSYTVRLRFSILEQAESLQLRNSNIVSTVGIYQRFGKWVWLQAEAGYSSSLNFNISETNFVQGSTLPKPNTDYLIKSDVTGAPFVSVSLFLSPPKEFIDKFLN